MADRDNAVILAVFFYVENLKQSFTSFSTCLFWYNRLTLLKITVPKPEDYVGFNHVSLTFVYFAITQLFISSVSARTASCDFVIYFWVTAK